MKEQNLTDPELELVDFVIGHTNKWKEDLRKNWWDKWDLYERLWLGIYQAQDKQRSSERSQLISPDTAQAVESFQADMNEAVFGSGKFFDIYNNFSDEDGLDVEKIRKQLDEDFKEDHVAEAISDIITYGAVYGTGIGEICIDDKTVEKPATYKQGGLSIGGVESKERFSVRLKPIHPKNFLIDPSVSNIEDSLGVAIESRVSAHIVIKRQREGVYRDVDIRPSDVTEDESITQSTYPYKENQISILTYYGLVPRELLEKIKDPTNKEGVSLEKELDEALGVDDNGTQLEEYGDLVEAIVVIANDGVLLKATPNPFMMKDRPIVVFRCDTIPNLFHGRGVVAKGENMQRAIDGQLRMHMDSAALCAAPMMGLDATRLPRGFNFEIRPGKSFKLNGRPSEIMEPMKFGEVSPISMETSQVLERKFLQAVGNLDAAGMVGETAAGNGQNTGISLAMAGIIKKHRRTLMSFQDSFLMPFIRKAAWRYMQYDPDRYPVKDYQFIPVSTLGLVAKEFEQQHLMAIMSTLGPNSPLVPLSMIKYVENSGFQDREAFITELKNQMKPNEELQKREQEKIKLENEVTLLQKKKIEAEINLNQAKTAEIKEDTRLAELEVRTKMISSLTFNSEEASEFDQRLQLADRALKEMDIDIKRAGVEQKERDSVRNLQITREQMQNQPKSA